MHRSGDEEMAIIGLQLLDLVAKRAPLHVQKVQECLVHNMADLTRYILFLFIDICMQ